MATSSASRDFRGNAGDYITTSSTAFRFGGSSASFTIVGWMNSDSTTGFHSIVSSFSAAASGWNTGTNTNDLWLYKTANVNSVTNFSTGVWYGFMIQWDNPNNNAPMAIMTEGGSLTYDSSTSTTSNVTAAGNLWIGGNPAASEEFNGRLQHIQIFNTTLTQQEWKEAMRNPGKVKLGNLLGYFPLWFSGSTEYNRTSTSANGTISGTVGTSTSSARGWVI